MVDTSKDELLLGGRIRHIRDTAQYQAHSNKVPACLLFKHANFRQYFVCLCERILNCCNVLTSSYWSLRSDSKRLSPRYYFCTDVIFRKILVVTFFVKCVEAVIAMPRCQSCQKCFFRAKNYPTVKLMLPAAAATTSVPYAYSHESLTHYCYDWHPGSRCGWTCIQLTSKVDGGTTGSQLSWSILT